MEEEHTVQTLNELLRGEYMAIRIYNETKDIQPDEELFRMFEQFEMDHRRHADKLAQRIKRLGGKPETSTGFPGVMSNAMGVVNSIRGPKYLLEQIYEGENKGIHAYEDRIDELDPDSRRLVKEIMDDDRQHLYKFQKRIHREKQNEHYR